MSQKPIVKDFADAIPLLDKAAGDSEVLKECMQIVRNDRKKLQNQLHVARRSAKTHLDDLRQLRREIKKDATSQLHSSNVNVKLKPAAKRLIKKSELKRREGWRAEVENQPKKKSTGDNEIEFTDHTRSNCNLGI